MNTFNKKITLDNPKQTPELVAGLMLHDRVKNTFRHLHESVKAHIGVMCAPLQDMNIHVIGCNARLAFVVENIRKDILSKSGYSVDQPLLNGFLVAYGINFMVMRSLILAFPKLYLQKTTHNMAHVTEKLLRYQTLGNDAWEIVSMLAMSLQGSFKPKVKQQRAFALVKESIITVPVSVHERTMKQLESIQDELNMFAGSTAEIKDVVFMALVLGTVLYDYGTFMYLCQDVVFTQSTNTSFTDRKIDIRYPVISDILAKTLSEDLLSHE